MKCPSCGAKENRPGAPCWLCEQVIPTNIGEDFVEDRITSDTFSFSLSTAMLLFTLASVVLGVIATLPGLGVIVAVLCVPVLVRTIRDVRTSETMGKEVRPVEKVGLFLASFVTVVIVAVAVCGAAFCSFCGVCLLMFSAAEPSSNREMALAGVGLCFLAIVCIGILVGMGKRSKRKKELEAAELAQHFASEEGDSDNDSLS